MGDTVGSDAVRYRTLLTDSALISVLFISGVAAFGMNAVPVALPAVGTEFHLTETEIGLVMSVFSVANLPMILVSSVLADIYGRRAVVIPSLLVFGLSGLATLWAPSYLALLALRAVQGFSFAATIPLATTLTGDLYTGAEGSAAQGIRSGLNGLAATAAPIAAGVLVAMAWQYPFALFALAIPVAGLVYLFYPEPVEPRKRRAGVSFLSEFREYVLDIWSAVDPSLALPFAGGFVLFFLKGVVRTFLAVFVTTGLGASVAVAGTVLGVYGGARVLMAPLSGTLVARLGRRTTLLFGTCAVALGMFGVPLAPNLWVVGLAAVCYGGGEGVLNPVLNDAVAAFASVDQRAGIVSGLMLSKQVAIIVSPPLVGLVIGLYGFATAFLLTGALAVAYALLLLVARRP